MTQLAPEDAIDLVTERFDVREALTALELINSNEEFLALAEASQIAVDRLGLGLGVGRGELEILTLVGVRALTIVATSPAATRDEVRHRARAYARQRCDARVATMLALSLERDRELHGMVVRDIH